MKNILSYLILPTAIVLLSSCEKIGNSVVPSGNVTEKSHSTADFYGLDISDAFNAYITFSEGDNSITIEANENLHEYIEVKNEGDRLIVGLRNNINIRRGNATLKVYITCEQLSSFEASGASNIYLSDLLRVPKAYIELSGASKLKGTVNVSELKADISGASEIELNGTLAEFEFDASGASNLKNYHLSTDYFAASLSGASNAQITVNYELDVEASGASNVYYKGNGIIKAQELSGASAIKKVN